VGVFVDYNCRYNCNMQEITGVDLLGAPFMVGFDEHAKA
jgi:hypothetical protein